MAELSNYCLIMLHLNTSSYWISDTVHPMGSLLEIFRLYISESALLTYVLSGLSSDERST